MASATKDVASIAVTSVSETNGLYATDNTLAALSNHGMPLRSVSSEEEGIAPIKESTASPDISIDFNTNTKSNSNSNINSDIGASREALPAVSDPPYDGNALWQQGQRGASVDPLTQGLSNTHLKGVDRLSIRLNGLPRDTTTKEIYNSLTVYGLEVVRIDISENIRSVRNGRAYVDFEPAPSRWPPWNGSRNIFTIHRRGSGPLRIQVEVLSHDTRVGGRFNPNIQTPLNHFVPRQVSFQCRGMLFGMMAREDAMLKLPQYEYRDVRLEFQFARRFVQITFNVDLGSKWGVRFYKIPIKFSHIREMLRIDKQDGCAIIIQLPSPPELLARMTDIQKSHDDALSSWQDRDSWERQLEITHQPHRAKYHPAQLTKNRKTVDIAQWLTYYLEVPSSVMESLVKHGTRLGDYNVKLGAMNSFNLVVPGQSVWPLLNPDLENSSSWFETVHLPFEVRYQLEVCISQGLFNEYSIDRGFLDKLLSYDSGTAPQFDRARMMLEGVADQNVQYYRPADIFEDPKIMHYWPTVKVSSQSAMVRRVVITPTGMYLKTPGVELTNRVLRKYSDLNDRFLRVQFTDELSFGKLWSCQGSEQSDWLYTRVLRVLRNGIVISDRHYKVLAWSNSQFREHGAFFFCANDHISCDDIRKWMGDLKHIRSVGKFAARMGQCFTTTRQLSGVSVPKIVEVEDIERETDGQLWNFTDGVGKISPFFAQMIAHEQNMLDRPSCFQFRMGGCKGVLVVWRDVAANEVHIRPSQAKFKAPYNGLEIIKVSVFSQATLNRQIIPIMSCLGVEDQVFIALLEEELEEYESAMTESYKASALLRQRVDENQTSLVLADMVDTFMSKQEPFMWTILRLWKCWALQRLKYKSAIGVKKSAFLFGCVDELGVLRGHCKGTEGKGVQDKGLLPQIFLQVPKQGTDPNNLLNYQVVTGLCVVGRNPSLHPGDIRVVEAVDEPGLRHLKNVVVFPQTGDRDIPSMCSGGDLDGDDFFVIWDERLLPKEWDFPPMNHDVSAPTSRADRADDINIDEMCAFFAEHMKNDCVGLVATAHFAWADQVTPKGDKCLELAKLHSLAVDYVKSGQKAVMHRSLRPKVYPHWMERKTGKHYTSRTAVGRIYDRIHVEKFSPAYDMPFDNRILSRFELKVEELAKPQAIKAQYDIAMRRLMGQHENPVSEFEIWSTFILSKPRVGNDYKLQEHVGREISALKDRFRMQCGEAITGVAQKSTIFSYAGIDLGKLDRFVAAMYKVTHEEVQDALTARALPMLDEEGNRIADDQGPDFPMPLISFPWLFHMELARIAQGGVPPAMWQPKKSSVSEAEGPKKIAHIASMLGNEHDKNHPQGTGTGTKECARVNANSDEASVNEDAVHTASGNSVRRGEMLELDFNRHGDQGEAINGCHAAADQILDVTATGEKQGPEGTSGEPGVELASDDSLARTSNMAASTIEAETGVQDEGGLEDAEDSDDEDDLEELADRLASAAVKARK
ncbi:unnamed protein product [Discula destructiva]